MAGKLAEEVDMIEEKALNSQLLDDLFVLGEVCGVLKEDIE